MIIHALGFIIHVHGACCIQFAQSKVCYFDCTPTHYSLLKKGVKHYRLPVCLQDKLNSLVVKQQKVKR